MYLCTWNEHCLIFLELRTCSRTANMLTQKCTHQRVCSLVSLLSIMGSSEMLLSTSTMTSKLQDVKKCLSCRSNERIKNLFITVVSRKRAHGWSTLQVCQRGGWALFRLFPHLTMKECPRHVYSDSKPTKKIIAHKITYNGITSSFEVESWRYTTLRTAQCDGEHSSSRCSPH